MKEVWLVSEPRTKVRLCEAVREYVLFVLLTLLIIVSLPVICIAGMVSALRSKEMSPIRGLVYAIDEWLFLGPGALVAGTVDFVR